jgi:hypothetical protein
MIKKIISPIVAIFFVSSLSAQVAAPLLFDMQNSDQLLTTLFDSETVNARSEVLWEPVSFSDRLAVSVSDDGFFHTRLDTVLYFSTFGINQAVAVFATYHYQRNSINECQACGVQLSLATFDETVVGQWQIERFVKHQLSWGAMGKLDDVELLQFGENQWGLQLSMGWIMQGIYSEHVTFIDLDDFSTIFSYSAHEDNEGVSGLPADRAYSFDRSIHFLNQEQEKTSGWWDFDLVSRGTRLSEVEEVAVPANYVQRYTYNWETGGYMKTCD